MNLLKELEKFNLTPNEAKVYVACLKLGPASVQQIGEAANLNRVTVYGLIEVLIDKGFLRQEYIKNKRKISAYPPMKLYDVVSRRQENLKRQERALEFLVPELKALMRPDDPGTTNIIYYEGEEGLRNWASEVLETKGEVLEWTKIETFAKPFEEYLEHFYFPKKFALQIPTRFIFLDTPEAHAYVQKRYMHKKASPMKARFIPPEQFTSPGFMVIYDDRLSIALPSEMRAVAVEDKLIADTQRQIFEFGWLHAKNEVQNKPYPQASKAALSPRERGRGWG